MLDNRALECTLLIFHSHFESRHLGFKSKDTFILLLKCFLKWPHNFIIVLLYVNRPGNVCFKRQDRNIANESFICNLRGLWNIKDEWNILPSFEQMWFGSKALLSLFPRALSMSSEDAGSKRRRKLHSILPLCRAGGSGSRQRMLFQVWYPCQSKGNCGFSLASPFVGV